MSALTVALAGTVTAAEQPSDDRLRELHALAESARNPAWRLALGEHAYQHARATEGELEGTRLVVTHRWLARLLRLGMTDRAVAVFESVPIHLRDELLAHPGETARASRLPVTWDFADVRLEMAAALVLENRHEPARELIKDARETPIERRQHHRTNQDSEVRSLLAILDRSLQPSESDPFDVFVDVIEKVLRDGLVESVTLRRLVASLAEREDYAILARYQYLTAARDLYHDADDPPQIPESKRTPALTASANRAMRAIDQLKSDLEERATFRSQAPPADPVEEDIRRLIAAPSIVDLREHPLPAGVEPVAMTSDEERSHRVALNREYKLPYPAVRVESRGKNIVALGSSHDYDPIPMSGGAYWVFRSSDGGASWDRPMYTGLRMHMPYVARPQSELPMVVPSGLRLEVEAREGDPDAIFFPGGFARFKRRELGLFVEIPWELLERDSDGDGLTDLAEERLITDPNDADTDRDGLDDGVDSLPHVPVAAETTERASLITAILETAHGSTHTDAGERTEFVVGTRAHFRGVRPPQRTIVLSSAEHADAVGKFGIFFATKIRVMFVNRVGNRGFAVWSGRWWGGTGIFEKVGTEWERTGGSNWIS